MTAMGLAEIWQDYKSRGWAAIESYPAREGEECFYLSALALREGHFESACAFATQHLQAQPESLVAIETEKYLRHVARSGKPEVYATARGFAHFIRAGGNVELYDNLSALIRRIYDRHGEIMVLDIGTGDGRALLPALGANVRRLDVLEPSRNMLEELSKALEQRQVNYRAFNETLQQFAKPATRWHIIQATYSLHSISPSERRTLLGWIRRHTDHFLMAEFDVPELSDACGPEHVRYALERYERGLAEYQGHERDVVAQEFLIPVLLGNFDRDRDRLTFEQSIDAWARELEVAGFTSVGRQLISKYWWADSYLLEARGG